MPRESLSRRELLELYKASKAVRARGVRGDVHGVVGLNQGLPPQRGGRCHDAGRPTVARSAAQPCRTTTEPPETTGTTDESLSLDLEVVNSELGRATRKAEAPSVDLRGSGSLSQSPEADEETSVTAGGAGSPSPEPDKLTEEVPLPLIGASLPRETLCSDDKENLEGSSSLTEPGLPRESKVKSIRSVRVKFEEPPQVVGSRKGLGIQRKATPGCKNRDFAEGDTETGDCLVDRLLASSEEQLGSGSPSN